MAFSPKIYSGNLIVVCLREEGQAVWVEEGEGEQGGLVLLMDDEEEERAQREGLSHASKLYWQKLEIPRSKNYC